MRNPDIDRSERGAMVWCCILFPIFLPMLPMLLLIWGIEEIQDWFWQRYLAKLDEGT